MQAAIVQTRVEVDSSGRRIRAWLTVENRSRETWSAEKGFAAAAQTRDAESGTMILDGPRTLLRDAVPPGESVELEVAAELRRINGRLHIFVSLLQEGVGWFFDNGSPFLLIECEVSGDDIRVTRETVTISAALRARRLVRSVKRAFSYPLLIFSRHGSLIRSMVRRDILGRYRGSHAGLFWTVIHPLLLMLTYYFVFGIVLRTRFGDDGHPSNFVLYFLAGMLPWLAFSEAVGRAPTTVIEHGNFVKKLVFPVEILPVTLVIAGLVSEAFGVGIFLAGMTVFGHAPTAAVFYLPLILIPQFLLTLGLCWLMAALGVFFRDLGQFIGFVLTVWFFTTPICYPEASLPENYRWLFELNPIYILVRSYRAIFLEASPPPWEPLAWLMLAATIVFLVGHGWFYKLKRSFSDVL